MREVQVAMAGDSEAAGDPPGTGFQVKTLKMESGGGGCGRCVRYWCGEIRRAWESPGAGGSGEGGAHVLGGGVACV